MLTFCRPATDGSLPSVDIATRLVTLRAGRSFVVSFVQVHSVPTTTASRHSSPHTQVCTVQPQFNSNMTSSTEMTACNPMATPREEPFDQRLPLYEEVKQFDHIDYAPPVLPSLTAMPTEVSDFLFQLLVSTEALSSAEQALDVAGRWRVGTGKDLREYPAMMFLEIFGNEEGWITYREVSPAITREKNKDFWYRWGFCRFCCPPANRGKSANAYYRHRARRITLLRGNGRFCCIRVAWG